MDVRVGSAVRRFGELECHECSIIARYFEHFRVLRALIPVTISRRYAAVAPQAGAAMTGGGRP